MSVRPSSQIPAKAIEDRLGSHFDKVALVADNIDKVKAAADAVPALETVLPEMRSLEASTTLAATDAEAARLLAVSAKESATADGFRAKTEADRAVNAAADAMATKAVVEGISATVLITKGEVLEAGEAAAGFRSDAETAANRAETAKTSATTAKNEATSAANTAQYWAGKAANLTNTVQQAASDAGAAKMAAEVIAATVDSKVLEMDSQLALVEGSRGLALNYSLDANQARNDAIAAEGRALTAQLTAESAAQVAETNKTLTDNTLQNAQIVRDQVVSLKETTEGLRDSAQAIVDDAQTINGDTISYVVNNSAKLIQTQAILVSFMESMNE